MAKTWPARLTQTLHRLASSGAAVSDADLLRRFLLFQEEAAFTALVRRHGSMVLGVCRRVLGNHHDAEDAFQATFLVLARKAHAVADPAALANWLYGVAYRTALKARAATARRLAKEMQMRERPRSAAVVPEDWAELEACLDQELQRLPDHYRLPVVLCDLEGLSRKAAAGRIGVSEGTLSGQLFRARRMLAQRLQRHGLVLSAGALATLLSQAGAGATPAPAVVQATVKAGVAAVTAPSALAAMVSAPVLSLTTGVIGSMYLHKLKQLSTALAVLVAVLGLGWACYALAATSPNPARATSSGPAPHDKRAAAKDQGPHNGGQAMADLLRNRKVLRELRCTVEQWDDLEDILEAADQRIQKTMTPLHKGGPGGQGGPPDFEKLHKQWMKQCQAEYGKAIQQITTTILKLKQVKRLGQLELQARGMAVYEDDRVRKALNLTGKQRAQVKRLMAKLKDDLQPKMQGGGMQAGPGGGIVVWNADPSAKEAQALTDRAMRAAVNLLTAEQKKAWNDLIGTPVKFLRPHPMSVGFINQGMAAMPVMPLPLPNGAGGVGRAVPIPAGK
jgi:RNA polymerase sigma factor (sigma-70 family)